MDVIEIDIAMVVAGGAGLRAAIAVAEADSSLTLALISKVYPMRSHTVAAEGGAAGDQGQRQPGQLFPRHRLRQ
jgi:fumarate reductase flavoprotein subunit